MTGSSSGQVILCPVASFGLAARAHGIDVRAAAGTLDVLSLSSYATRTEYD
jgi:hypothetical protein